MKTENPNFGGSKFSLITTINQSRINSLLVMNLGNTFKVRSYNFREKLGLLKNIILMLCLVILPIIPHSEFSAYPGGCRAWGLPGGASQGLDFIIMEL